MTDALPNPNAAGAGPTAVPTPRRAHTYSRLTTAVAVLALASGIYALLRVDALRDRLDDTNEALQEARTERSLLEAELRALEARERETRAELQRRLGSMNDLPTQVQELANTMSDLQGRTLGPERAWSRAEALFLLEMAQQRLALDRDVETAMAALQSADLRLATLKDAAFAPVRMQIARELQALRTVRQPDRTGILARLATAEERAASLSIRGLVAEERRAAGDEPAAQGFPARALAFLRRAFGNVVVVRRVDAASGTVLTREEALLRREHLQLLLFSAKSAVARHDRQTYRSSLASARQWLGEFFDLSDPAVSATLSEIQSLEPIDIDPQLPDISESARLLRRMMPGPAGPE